MKMIKNLLLKVSALAMATIVIGCGQSPLEAGKTQYQQKAVKTLNRFANNVSRGFKASSSKSRGAYADSSYGQPYQGYIIRQAVEQEVQDCVELITQVPQSCDTYNFMVSSLSRCLNRVITYRNPLLTYAYKNLDKKGQQYWTYLLDSRRPQSLDFYMGGSTNMMPLANYASQGYVGSDY